MSKFFIAILLLPALIWAQPQQSENFRIVKSVIDAGGQASSSANFRLVSAFGQPTPLGPQSSASFALIPGFLSPLYVISPLSPVQALVIQEYSGNIRLIWNRADGAESYAVYRDTTVTFTPSAANRITVTGDSTYTDTAALGLPPIKHYYIVQSSDTPPPGVVARKDMPPHMTTDTRRTKQ